MCRAGGRRCRGASTTRAATRDRKRRHRDRQRSDTTTAASPATSERGAAPEDASTATGGDVTPQPRRHQPREVEDHTSDHTDTGTEHEREWKMKLGPAPTEGERARLEAFMKKMQAWAAASPDDRFTAGAKRDATTRAEIQARQARAAGSSGSEVINDTKDAEDAAGDVTHRPHREVEDHTTHTDGSNTRTGGRGTGRASGVGPVSGNGNLTLVSPQGPLHISRSRDGYTVRGDVTSVHNDTGRTGQRRVRSDAERRFDEDQARLVAQAAEASGRTEREVLDEIDQVQQRARRAARQGDVTSTCDSTSDAAARRTARKADRVERDQTQAQFRDRGSHGSAGPVNVVGDGNVTITGAGRVTNYAGPGAWVGHQSTGHVDGASVTMGSANTGDAAWVRAEAARIREQAHREAAQARRDAHTGHAQPVVSGTHVIGVQAPVTFGTVVIGNGRITIDGRDVTPNQPRSDQHGDDWRTGGEA